MGPGEIFSHEAAARAVAASMPNDELLAELARLRAENADLRAAMEPFAEVDGRFRKFLLELDQRHAEALKSARGRRVHR